MVGGNQSLQPIFWRSMIRATALEGVCYVVTESKASDDFRAIGLWFGPGHSFLGR